jgi:hypothetical protein
MWFYKLFLKFEPTTTILNDDDETLPIINKLKHPKKRIIQGTKWKDPCPRRQKKPPKRANHKGNIKLPNPLLSQKAY